MSTRRAIAFSFLDRYAALLLSVVSSMFIARLLTPAEIGVFSVTMVLLAFISALRDFGAGQYIVQEKELTPDRVRGAWTILLGTGLGFGLLVLLLAIPVARFYRDERIVGIMLVISANFVINPFGSLTYAWLMRQLRFDTLAVMRFAGALTGALVSVTLAWKGMGPISLAFGSLASTCVNAAVAIAYRPASFPWWPGLRELRRVFAFGGKVSATSLLNAAGGSGHEVLMGRLQGLETTAFLSRANGLVAMFHRLFMEATQAVAAPLFAKEAREQGQFNQSFLRAISYITAIGWSFFIGLAFLAHPVVHLLYGDQWGPTVDATRILCLAYMLGLPAALCPAAITASGQVGVTLKLTAQSLVVHLLLMVVGANFGLIAIAWAFVASYAIGVLIWLGATKRAIHFGRKPLGQRLLESFGVAMCTSVGPALSIWTFGWAPASPAGSIAVACGIGVPAFLGSVYLLKHPLAVEISLAWSKLRRVRS